MASTPRYHYTPLGEGRNIRLLCLKPGDKSSSTQISIFHACLDQYPTYEALSYTWGDPNETTSLRCNDGGDTISITRNCEAALQRLRKKEEERILWIDAICIDQSNVEERGEQVQLMSAIYRQADRVLAYLGEASDDSHVGMDFILQDAKALGDRPSVGLGEGITSSPQQMAIDHILERSYFERIWVIQEIVFAREVQVIIGDAMAEWIAFSRTVYYVDINKKIHRGINYVSRPPSVVFYRDKATKLSNRKSISDKPDSLLELLRDTRHCKSTDPRDKIFALLSMSLEHQEPILAPNYALSTREIFITLVKFTIGRDRILDILCHVQGTPSIHDLPSWVPDWSFQYVPEVIGNKKDSVRPYKADSGRNANVHFETNPDTLICEGVIYDTIAKYGAVYNMGMEESSSTLKQWETKAKALSLRRTVDISAAFIDTLIAYPGSEGPNPFGAMFYPSWRSLVFERNDLGKRENAEATIFQDQVNKACNGRAFFTTEKGCIGIGPADIRKGDVMAVLLGGSVPFVLRKVKTHFTLVGECYVHGVMKGEAIQEGDLEMICIR